MSKDVSSFLSKLDEFNKEVVKVYIPSRKETIEVKPLNLKQQKDLISSALDGIKGNLDFNKTVNKIIIDNTGISDLELYDKVPVLISLRKNSLGDSVREGDEVISLSKVVTNIKNTQFKLKRESTVKFKNLTVNLKIPTLKDENILIAKCEQDISNTNDVLKEEVGLLYIFEILKYINSLVIGEQEIILPEIRINERIRLVEKLPLSLYRGISKFIEEVNNYTNTLLTVDSSTLVIDSTFFDTSSD
tara:strand:- start:824 stop:1561 length:738 start_codon:yes stop_codon:yes gene_type:complete